MCTAVWGITAIRLLEYSCIMIRYACCRDVMFRYSRVRRQRNTHKMYTKWRWRAGARQSRHYYGGTPRQEGRQSVPSTRSDRTLVRVVPSDMQYLLHDLCRIRLTRYYYDSYMIVSVPHSTVDPPVELHTLVVVHALGRRGDCAPHADVVTSQRDCSLEPSALPLRPS